MFNVNCNPTPQTDNHTQDRPENAMPRQVATYDDVKHAAVTLISRGDVPTLERMRAIIGHGSYSTIRNHYQRFQNELKQQPKAL